MIKCFEKLVLHYMTTSLPPTFNPHQFAYRPSEDAIATHTALNQLEHRESYVRMLYVNCSSAFSTIILDILVSKLQDLGLSIRSCTSKTSCQNWPPPLLLHHINHRCTPRLCAVLMTQSSSGSSQGEMSQCTLMRFRDCQSGSQWITLH